MGMERRDAFREIDELKRQIHALKEYIHLRDGTPFDELYERIKEVRIDYSAIPDEKLRRQLEEDNLMMLRAWARDDFWAYCQNAILQLEAILNYAYAELSKTNRDKLKRSWDKQQQEKTKRYIEIYTNYNPVNFNNYRKTFSDLLEAFCIYLYEEDNEKRSDWCRDNNKKFMINSKYWTLVNTNQIRNTASHRDGLQTKFERLKKDKQHLYKFYQDRHLKSYYGIADAMKELFNDILNKIKDASSRRQGY